MAAKESFLIAQLSDIHCGDPRFDADLLTDVISGINAAQPDLVVVPGDLTTFGYRDQFEEARGYLDRVECPQKIVLSGNHDARNVGYVHFEQIIGQRQHEAEFAFHTHPTKETRDRIKVVAVDSAKPDLDDGWIGREKYDRIARGFAQPNHFKLFVLHHHLVSIPGTGRERNIVWDAGDVLELLKNSGTDLVMAGHKHVPYVWHVAGMAILTSGTASTHRTRGFTPPSYNMVEITASEIRVSIKSSDGGSAVEEVLPRRADAG